MRRKVFVSVGTPGDSKQKAFRDAIINAVDTAGLEPRLFEQKDWDYKNPLRGIRRVMDECSGVLVVAYPRYEVTTGTQLRGGVPVPFASTFVTPWIQIEAAMAYEKGLPLFIIADERLQREAVLDSANDVIPLWTPLDAAVVQEDRFKGQLHSWKDDVNRFYDRASDATTGHDITVGRLLSAMPWYELVALVVTVIGVLVGFALIGYRIGKGQPWLS